MHRRLAFGLLSLAGCAHGAPSGTTPVAAPGGARYFVVEDVGEVRSTHVIAADGTLVRTLTGASLVATDDDVYVTTTARQESPRPSCADLNPEVGEQNPAAGVAHTVELAFTGLLGGRSVSVVHAAADPEASSIEQSVSIDGMYGPYVLGREDVWQFSCGAHGSTSTDAFFVDLAQGAVLRAPGYPFPSVGEAALVAAGEQLVAESEETLHPDEVEPSMLTPTLLLPDFEEGRFTVRLQYTVDACYACSDGRWSSYTRSTHLEIPTPAPFVGLPALPATIAAYVRGRAGSVGVSWTTADVATRALARLP